MKTSLSEGEIQLAVLEYINIQPGWWAYRVNNLGVWDKKINAYRKRSKFNIPGQPDINCFGPNKRVVFLELKGHKGVQSDEQKAFEFRIKKLGHEYYVIRGLIEARKVIENVNT